MTAIVQMSGSRSELIRKTIYCKLGFSTRTARFWFVVSHPFRNIRGMDEKDMQNYSPVEETTLRLDTHFRLDRKAGAQFVVGVFAG